MLKAYVDSGDLVRCNNCGAEMLVPYGADICPNCRRKGCLQWLDEDNQESDIDLLDQDYETCELPDDYEPNDD